MRTSIRMQNGIFGEPGLPSMTSRRPSASSRSRRPLPPGHTAVLTAHYRYNLYKHCYGPAQDCAERLLAAAARSLKIPLDWQDVRPAHADFRSQDPDIRFWLFVLQAYGYVLLQLDRRDLGMVAMRHVAMLDADDQTKTRAPASDRARWRGRVRAAIRQTLSIFVGFPTRDKIHRATAAR
jgi:hypothetical protein